MGGQNNVSREEGVNVAFKKLVHEVLKKIKHEPDFCWPSKMSEDLAMRN